MVTIVLVPFKTRLVVQEGRNAMVNKRYRWTFPIAYILGDDLGEFSFYCSLFSIQ